MKKPVKKQRKFTPEEVALILNPELDSAELAKQLGVSTCNLRYFRRKHSLVDKAGRRKLQVSDFPETNWRQPVIRLSKQLGVCWRVATRLKADAIGSPITACSQVKLPGFKDTLTIPSDLAGVDWTENASVIARNLGLDSREVLRLKSMATRKKRLHRPL